MLDSVILNADLATKELVLSAGNKNLMVGSTVEWEPPKIAPHVLALSSIKFGQLENLP